LSQLWQQPPLNAASNVIVNYNQMLSQEWDYLRQKALIPLETYLTTGDQQVVFSKKEYMAIYGKVYELCIQQIEGFQAELYDRYTKSIRAYITQQVLPRLEPLHGQDLLKELELRWANHLVMVKWMQRFFQYLDRFYVEMSSIASLTEQGFAQFKAEVFGRLLNKITDAVLCEVQNDRNNYPVDLDLLKKVVAIYTFLSTDKIPGVSSNCQQELEDKLLQASRTFFQSKANQMIQTYTLVDYLQQADLLLQSEKARLERCLGWPSFDSKLLSVFQEEILMKY